MRGGGSICVPDGSSFFVLAGFAKGVDEGARPLVEGTRAKMIRGERPGELAPPFLGDPDGRTDRVEVAGDVWLDL
ncbi:MAG TPA: hypothetical protein DEF51_51395 [Myxococcales bacterium]|nr:hypothetical protein [Myxococcales bacterium]